MRIPHLCENLLYIVLVHAEIHQVDLGAGLANEGAVGDVGMSGLSLLAIDAIGVELVVRD